MAHLQAASVHAVAQLKPRFIQQPPAAKHRIGGSVDGGDDSGRDGGGEDDDLQEEDRFCVFTTEKVCGLPPLLLSFAVTYLTL